MKFNPECLLNMNPPILRICLMKLFLTLGNETAADEQEGSPVYDGKKSVEVEQETMMEVPEENGDLTRMSPAIIGKPNF